MIRAKRFGVLLAFVTLVIAGCYGKPIPHIVAAPHDCKRVKILLAGDSLMLQTAKAIVTEFEHAGFPVKDIVVAHGGASAVEFAWFDAPEGFANPREELQYHLDAFRPDIVLAEWGINQVGSLQAPEWQFLIPWAVQTAMHDVVRTVRKSGAQLYWATIPRRGDDSAVFANDVNAWILALGVPLVDWRGAVSDENGTYAQYLRYPEDGVARPVRLDDGVHFTPEGIDRVAKWTVSTLAPVACRSRPAHS
ncbi:MAG: hypothetical protein ACHQIG_08250 [Acidimicrobiia bacterium]